MHLCGTTYHVLELKGKGYNIALDGYMRYKLHKM